MHASMLAVLPFLFVAGHVRGEPAGPAGHAALPIATAQATMAADGDVPAKVSASQTGPEAALLRREQLSPVAAHVQNTNERATVATAPALSELAAKTARAQTKSRQSHATHATTQAPAEHEEHEHEQHTYADALGTEDGHWVSCGGHVAPRCRVCTMLDPETGLPWPNNADKGADWCRGNCKWYDGECQMATNYNGHIEHEEGSGEHRTTAKPELINPDLTLFDKQVVAEAARRAVQEATYESNQRASNAERAIDEENDTTNNYVLYMMQAVGACLCVVALGSCFYVAKFAMGKDKLGPLPQQAQQEPEPAAAPEPPAENDQ